MKPARAVSAEPSALSIGDVHVNVAEPVAGAVFTVIENAAREVLVFPSLTLMMMFEDAPTFAADGVPESRPDVVLNVAQTGLF